MNNLFVSSKERHRRKLFGRLKIYALIIIIIFLLWGIYYLLSELSIFKISELEIESSEKLSKSYIMSGVASEIFQKYTSRLLGFNNIFSWPSGEIHIDNPLIADASITKDIWRRKIKINISERKKYGAWCEQEKCFWFDENGVIFEPAPESEGKLIFKIKSNSSIVGPDLFKNLKKILENIKDDFLFEDFYFDDKGLDLKTKIINGPNLIFNLRFDPETNLAALKEMKKRKEWPNFKVIDLKISGKVFYQ